MPLFRCVESKTLQTTKPIVFSAVLVFMLLSLPAWTAQSCQGVDLQLTAARKEAYGRLVEASITKPLKPGSAVVTRSWRVANGASPGHSRPITGKASSFYHQEGRKTRFVEVRGGYAIPSEKPELIRWACSLGANFPEVLARCFADEVTDGHWFVELCHPSATSVMGSRKPLSAEHLREASHRPNRSWPLA